MKYFHVNRIIQRTYCGKPPPAANAIGFTEKPNVNTIQHDYIGPPDKQSNLRPILRCIPKGESPLQNRLRTQRIEVEKWNQEFWSNHNKRFIEEKQDFMKLNKTTEGDPLSADKMSEFYKYFLDKNWQLHMYYNLSWYMKNLNLLMLAAQVNIMSLFKWRK